MKFNSDKINIDIMDFDRDFSYFTYCGFGW